MFAMMNGPHKYIFPSTPFVLVGMDYGLVLHVALIS
jgi:hypothetical protein